MSWFIAFVILVLMPSCWRETDITYHFVNKPRKWDCWDDNHLATIPHFPSFDKCEDIDCNNRLLHIHAIELHSWIEASFRLCHYHRGLYAL